MGLAATLRTPRLSEATTAHCCSRAVRAPKIPSNPTVGDRRYKLCHSERPSCHSERSRGISYYLIRNAGNEEKTTVLLACLFPDSLKKSSVSFGCGQGKSRALLLVARALLSRGAEEKPNLEARKPKLLKCDRQRPPLQFERDSARPSI